MANDKLLIGSHVTFGSPEYYLGSVKEAISFGETTFMFYTGAPQNSLRKPLEELWIEEGRKLIKEVGMDESKIVVHAPYIINLANKSDIEKHEASKRHLYNELIRTAAFNCQILVFHPGNHMNQGVDIAIKYIVESLDEIFDKLPKDNNVKIALETMAGKGSEVGSTFEQIAQIIALSRHKNRLGVCFDTCHVSDAGYNLFDKDGVFEEFDRVIGLDKLLVIHVNDSLNPMGAHKDRHANIGYGELGFDILNSIVNDERFANIPKILETPRVPNTKISNYKLEVEMFKNQKYIPNWKDSLN